MTNDCKTCPVSTGTHHPAEAVHQIAEPQAEALRLAAELVEPIDGFQEPTMLEATAAAELRRLHARITELESQLDAIGAGGVEPLRKREKLHQIAEPVTAGTAVRAFRDYLGVHDGIKLGGQAMDDIALDLARIALDFKHLVEPQHPDDAAVDALAVLMKAKLAKQRAKGYGGWNDKTQCPQQRLSDMLRAHVDKGDPVDVANFCAMLSARGEGIAAAPQAVQAAVPLPLLVRDIARDLGITVPQACIALKPLGNYSTNSAVTAEMARMLRDHFPAPVHPAEGVPAQDVEIKVSAVMLKVAALIEKRVEAEPCAEAEAELLKFLRAALAATQPAAQGMEARDAAFEDVRKAFCKLQRYSFALDSRGNLRRCADHCGNWVEFEAVHTLFEPQSVDAAIAAQAKQGGA